MARTSFAVSEPAFLAAAAFVTAGFGPAFLAAAFFFTAGFGAATLAAAARSSLEGCGDIPSITLGSRAYG